MIDVREKLMELLQCGGVRDFPFNAVLADHLISNGVTVLEWISVKYPPKNRGCYLVTVKHWLDGKPVVREARWNGVDWLSCYKAEELTPRVTHWMPMPEPPKGGGAMKDDFEFLRGLANCQDKEQMARYIEEHRQKPMTNADRIRAMSDWALAKHLADIGWDCHFCTEHRRLDNEPLLRGEKCDEKCAEHCLEWLRQPTGDHSG